MNRKDSIKQYIFDNIENHSVDIVELLSKEFKISRQRAHFYLSREVRGGSVIRTGNNRWTSYFLAKGNKIRFVEKIKKGLADDSVWSKYVKPMLASCAGNIRTICAYGFTEMYNNAIEHSHGSKIVTDVALENGFIKINIFDDGVGIFKKIQKALKLDTINESILHLSKGKFTTDPKNHTGEGIFFTSRLFDKFSIFSSNMYYVFENEEWFLSPEKVETERTGTFISMKISLVSRKIPKDVFDQYSDKEIGFGKTIVAVALSADPNDPHVSRSQAKRLLMGLEKFNTIILDFKGVVYVGQAFVDEVFRVFKNEYPKIEIQYINANEDVDLMIKRGVLNREADK